MNAQLCLLERLEATLQPVIEQVAGQNLDAELQERLERTFPFGSSTVQSIADVCRQGH